MRYIHTSTKIERGQTSQEEVNDNVRYHERKGETQNIFLVWQEMNAWLIIKIINNLYVIDVIR